MESISLKLPADPEACATTSAKERFAIPEPVPASLARSCPRSFPSLALLASVRMTALALRDSGNRYRLRWREAVRGHSLRSRRSRRQDDRGCGAGALLALLALSG